MSNKLRINFTATERNTIIQCLRDEYGDREFSDELVLLECQDLWRKGCHNLEDTEDCRGMYAQRISIPGYVFNEAIKLHDKENI